MFKKDSQTPRSEVLQAAVLMEQKLRKHDHDRGPKGWKNDHPLCLFHRVKEEVCEAQEVVASDMPKAFPDSIGRKKLVDELVDVMNFCMMTIDQLGGLSDVELAVETEGGKVPFTEAAVMGSLDRLIIHWRDAKKDALAKKHDVMADMATHYIDAYQSVRVNLFGEALGG